MGRELTKLNEECLWGTAAEIRSRFSGRPGGAPPRAVRGELTFVIAAASKKERRDAGNLAEEIDSSAENGNLSQAQAGPDEK